MKRIFIGLPAASDFSLAVGSLREPAAGVRWIPSRNLHITVEFLGATDEDQLGTLREQLHQITVAPFVLDVASLVALPAPRRARVIAIAFHLSSSFETLYYEVRSAAVAAGLVLKSPRLSPHLTIARIRRPDRQWLTEYLEKNRQTVLQMPAVEVNYVNVYESALSPSGADYTVVDIIPMPSAHGREKTEDA